MLLKHVITAALALVPSIVLADSPALRALPVDDGVLLEIAINRKDERGMAQTMNKTLLITNGAQVTTHEGSVNTLDNHKLVFTGLTLSASAYSATENVVAVRLSLSDSTLIDAKMDQHSGVKTIASVTDRWLSLHRGETVQMMIGEDDVALRVR